MSEKSWIERHPYLTTAGVVAGTAGLGALAHKLGPTLLAARKAAKAGAKKVVGKASKGSTSKAVEKVTGKTPKKRVAWSEPAEAGEGAAATSTKTIKEHVSGLFEGGKKTKGVKGLPSKAEMEKVLDPKTVARVERYKTVKSAVINAFTEELSRIHAEKVAVAIIKDPSDKLDRRTSRHFRKPNPRILPAPLPSGKLVV